MTVANIYLNFAGKTEEAFTFYKSVFGGEFSAFQRFGDTPMAGTFPPTVLQKVMHVALQITPNCTLMGTDALAELGQTLTPGNNVSISLHPDSREEADKLFAALSAGGQVGMPLADAFWGAYFGTWVDAFGTRWMINYVPPKP